MVSPVTRDIHILRKVSTVGMFPQPVCRLGMNALQKVFQTFSRNSMMANRGFWQKNSSNL